MGFQTLTSKERKLCNCNISRRRLRVERDEKMRSGNEIINFKHKSIIKWANQSIRLRTSARQNMKLEHDESKEERERESNRSLTWIIKSLIVATNWAHTTLIFYETVS